MRLLQNPHMLFWNVLKEVLGVKDGDYSLLSTLVKLQLECGVQFSIPHVKKDLDILERIPTGSNTNKTLIKA